MTERDAEALKRIQPLMRYLGAAGLLSSEDWEPHAPTAQPDAIFASRFSQSRHWGPLAAALHNVSMEGLAMAPPPCEAWSVWTLVERSGQAWPSSSQILRIAADDFAGCAFYDLWRGVPISANSDRGTPHGALHDTELVLRLPLEANGFGAVLAVSQEVASAVSAAQAATNRRQAAAALSEPERLRRAEGSPSQQEESILTPTRLAAVLTRQAALTATPLDAYQSEWRPAPQARVPHSSSAFRSGDREASGGGAGSGGGADSSGGTGSVERPHEAVLVRGSSAFDFRCNGMVIEPFESDRRDRLGIDVQFDWEPFARNEHVNHALAVPSFYMDPAPVGQARFAAFLAATGYAPHDERNFLREWPDWRAQRFPDGNATVPVTGVSLAEARLFCAWAGGRLPTTFEWQYAAQAGDASNVYPWGGTQDNTAKRPAVVHGGRTPAPADSEASRESGGVNALGIYDLVGNVWQYTDSEYADGHTRFVLLRGGSRYQPRAASDFENWYFGSEEPTTRPGGATRLDRHAKYFLMSDAYERAATIGFRCVYDPVPGGVADGALAPGDAGAGAGGAPPARDFGIAMVCTLLFVLGVRAAAKRCYRKQGSSKSRSARGVELADADAYGNDDDL